MIDQLTHTNENSETPLVDAGEKKPALRTARASGVINMSPAAANILAENAAQKGDVLGVARIAAIQGCKQTGFLIPLCQPFPLSHVRVDFDVDLELARVKATVTAATEAQTGVEMEAMMGVNIALLTIYDMLKTVDKSMTVTQIHLEEQSGGRSGPFVFDNAFENIDY